MLALSRFVKLIVTNNENAGAGVSRSTLHRLLRRHGHEVTAVAGEADLVVAAGGDGTVAKVARSFARRGIPLAILPLGTANNIAASLGIATDTTDIDALVGGWPRARRAALDLALVTDHHGERYAIEGAGVGLVPRAIQAAEQHPRTEDGSRTAQLRRAARRYREVLAAMTARPISVRIDGAEVSGDVLACEVLNIRSIGPNLVFAPEASPSDGRLTVALVYEADRRQLADYLQSKIDGQPGHLALDTRRGEHIELVCEGDVHVDDDVDPCGGRISIRIDPGALEVLV